MFPSFSLMGCVWWLLHLQLRPWVGPHSILLLWCCWWTLDMIVVVFLSRASASHLSLQYVNPMNCMMRYGVGSYGESATNLFNGHFLCWMVRSKLICNNSLSLPHYKIYGLFISCRPPILILGSFFSFFSIDFQVRTAEKADGTMWNCVRFPLG